MLVQQIKMDKDADLVQIPESSLTWFVSMSALIYLCKLQLPHLFPSLVDFGS